MKDGLPQLCFCLVLRVHFGVISRLDCYKASLSDRLVSFPGKVTEGTLCQATLVTFLTYFTPACLAEPLKQQNPFPSSFAVNLTDHLQLWSFLHAGKCLFYP